jgi:hypothetical protein
MRPLLAVAFAALGTLAVSAALAGADSLKPLPWDQASQGLPVVTVGGKDVWIHSVAFKSVRSSVYRVDPRRATLSPTPLKQQFLDLFSGDGALWASGFSITEPTRQRLYWIDIAHGFHLEEKVMPVPCEFGDGGHSVVWQGRLWLTCSRFGVYAFTQSSSRPVQALPIPDVQALLATSNGLWAATTVKVQRIAGAGKGAFVLLPISVDGDYASNVGWAVDETTVWALGRGPHGPQLARLDLRNRKATAFGISVPGLSSAQPCCGIAIAGPEVLLADSQHLRIVRYAARHPWKPIGFITLPGQRSEKSDVTITGVAGVAWITVHDPKGFHLYRLTVST